MRKLLASVMMVFSLSIITTHATAALMKFNIVGQFSGPNSFLGTVYFDITVENTFDALYFGSDGLTVNKLTSTVLPGDPFVVDGGLNYFYDDFSGQLRISGGLPTFLVGNDIDIRIGDFLTAPDPEQWLTSNSTSSPAFSGDGTFDFFSVTAVAVPAPSTIVLFGMAFMGLVGLRNSTSFRNRFSR